MIDHCLEALRAEAELRFYRAYVTDALMVLTENTARFNGGRRLTRRWADALGPRDDRSGDAVAADLIARAGLRVRG